MEEPKTDQIISRLIRTAEIVEPVLPMRSMMDAETLNELAESIKAHGVLEPLIVRPKGKLFEIVAGHRRFLAAQRAGLSEVPCVIRVLNDVEGELIKFAENFAREDADPIAQAFAFSHLLTDTKWTHQELAVKLGVSTSLIDSRLAIIDYPEDVRMALAEKKINISVAKLLAQIDDAQHRIILLGHAISDGATAYTVSLWLIDYQRMKGYRPAAETIEGAALGEKEIKTLLGDHPNCDFCDHGMDGKRRVMMIVCGECWDEWNRQSVERTAQKIANLGSKALET